MKPLTKLSAVAATILLSVTLAACASSPAGSEPATPEPGAATSTAPTFADLIATDVSEKELPAELPDYALDGVDLDSVRWVGEHEGTDVWLAAPVEGSDYDACILAFPDAQDWTSGCGGGVSGPDQRWYAIVADGQEPPEGSIALSKNVYVEGE